MTIPAPQTIKVTRGDTYHMYLGLNRLGVRINLTGATVTGEVRASVDSTTIMGTFACTLANQTTDPGGILCTLAKETTATFTTNGVYDIQVDFADGDRSTVVGGPMELTKDVTRGA